MPDTIQNTEESRPSIANNRLVRAWKKIAIDYARGEPLDLKPPGWNFHKGFGLKELRENGINVPYSISVRTLIFMAFESARRGTLFFDVEGRAHYADQPIIKAIVEILKDAIEQNVPQDLMRPSRRCNGKQQARRKNSELNFP